MLRLAFKNKSDNPCINKNVVPVLLEKLHKVFNTQY